ncbi:MAG: chemotaxis-specific protein-glutamate methyltransferase CheB [Spirochaetaceae bacterium]|nr:chemotaxis-specific protein-glutamate methyltransferase CheB [Spirochaetaceae bacterium]
MIKVLVAEDSPASAQLIEGILSSDEGIEVVGIATDGQSAISEIERLNPDLVIMDIHMPRLDGFQATRAIMEKHPIPIVIVSSSFDESDTEKTFKALEAGALMVMRKPRGMTSRDFPDDSRKLINMVKTMSEVPVIRRYSRIGAPDPILLTTDDPAEFGTPTIVAIGASTGGPPVIKTILSALPRTFPAPILIVQHIAIGFTEGFVAWIASTTDLPGGLAQQGELMLPGHVYFAPDHVHLLAQKDGRIGLSRDAPVNGLRPSVARLFGSVAENYGSGAIGILLSGMGDDGARELLALRTAGAMTVAQDEESCAVFGMPGAAVMLGAVRYVLSPVGIAQLLIQCAAPRRPTDPGARVRSEHG